jgi:hypothetical protein
MIDACLVETMTSRSGQSSRLAAHPPSVVIVSNHALARIFPRKLSPVACNHGNRRRHGHGCFFDTAFLFVRMARLSHKFVHHEMRTDAKQEWGESRCIAPHARQCAAGKKKSRNGQQHDDATRHHSVMHEPVRDRLFSVVLVVHDTLIVSFFAPFATLQQGKVKDTNGYTSRGLVRLPDAGSPVKEMQQTRG